MALLAAAPALAAALLTNSVSVLASLVSSIESSCTGLRRITSCKGEVPATPLLMTTSRIGSNVPSWVVICGVTAT